MFDQDMWNSFSPLLHGVDNVHALETPLYSDHLQVAGTVDCIAEYKGKLSVVDFKTSSRIKSKKDIHSYFMQCAAYSVAFEERTGISVPRLVILMAVDNEEPLVFVEKRDAWIGKFIEMREEFRQWKKY
jgi:genome maintenance exonuclease 1